DRYAEKAKALDSATRSAEGALDAFNDAADRQAGALEELTKAQTELDKARSGPTVKDRAKAESKLTDERLSLEDATFAVEDAEQQLVKAQQSGDPRAVARAQNDLAQARQRLQYQTETTAEAEKELNEILTFSADTSPKVVEAQD